MKKTYSIRRSLTLVRNCRRGEAGNIEAWFDDLPESVLKYEWPKTPYLARLHGLDGYGVYRLNIDRATGTVSSVTVVKTTTHKMLDDAAVDAFRKWRFRPNSISELPGTFTVIGSGKRHPLSEARRLAIYAPTPERPRSGRSGTGLYRFIIDYNSGRTTDVQIIKSSGMKASTPQWSKLTDSGGLSLAALVRLILR